MKLIINKKYRINYNWFYDSQPKTDTVEYDGIWTSDASDLRCEICGKLSHKKLHKFHSLESIHTWYYFGTSCIDKIKFEG